VELVDAGGFAEQPNVAATPNKNSARFKWTSLGC
jgi:hypothetical protein